MSLNRGKNSVGLSEKDQVSVFDLIFLQSKES